MSLPASTRAPSRIAWLVALSGIAPACITSPVWEYGATRDARLTRLEACPNGMLDDGEDGNAQIIKSGGRDGYWFTFKDSWGSTIEPMGEFKMSPSDRPGSKYVAAMRGKMAASGASLYAGLGFAFTNPKTPFDLSFAQGIRFWAKGPGKIRFKIPDANTSPEGDRCNDCYNDFGVDLYLQDEWVRYTIPFAKMTQQSGWGDRAPKLSTRELFAVEWQFNTPGADYDISIDDVELVGCEESHR